jgi:hypothetical protein
MWVVSGWIAWIVSAAIFLWLIADFFRTNSRYSEEQLLSSREGVDELYPDQAKTGAEPP